MAGEHVLGVYIPVFEPVSPLFPLKDLKKNIFYNHICGLIQEVFFQLSLGYENVIPGV